MTISKVNNIAYADLAKFKSVTKANLGKMKGVSKPSSFANTGSLQFDGTNDVLDFGDITLLDGLTTLTISMWVNFDTVPGTYSTARDLFTKGPGSNSTKGIAIRIAGDGGSGNGVRFGFQTPGNFLFTTSHPTIETGTWYHIALTMAALGFNFYVNGALASSANQGGGVTIQNVSQALQIGNGPGQANDGYIDEVAVFNTTKSLSDIQGYFNSGVPTDLSSEGGLIGYWRMEEGSGSTVADSSSNSNAGTLTNGAAFTSNVPS